MSEEVDVDDAIYVQVDEITGAELELDENVCYGIRKTRAESNLNENERVTASKIRSCNKMIFAFALVMLICAVAVCTAIAAFVEISQFNSELASIRKSISLSNQEALALTNSSIRMIGMRFSQDLSAVENQIMAILQNLASCAAILQFAPSSPSGHYLIRSSNGSAVRVYCDMTRSCGNITGGWMRVAELDMRDSSSQCPSALRNGIDCSIPSCIMNIDSPNCSSVIFPSHGFNYSRVCGMIRAYQKGIVDSILNDGHIRSSPTIDSNYVDGISLTYGESPRQHIWTFGVGLRGI